MSIMSVATRVGSRALLQVRKASPEILIGAGIAGFIGTTVLTARATLKLEGLLDHHQTDIQTFRALHEDYKNQPEKYSDRDFQKDLFIQYTKFGVDLVKLYGVPIVVGAGSIACLIGSHGIMRQRNTALLVAYGTLDKAFQAYRGRVALEYGEDKERAIAHGVRTETVTKEVDGVMKKEKVEVLDPNTPSVYAKFFDESSDQWENNVELNLFFLNSQQNYMNDRLRAKGHVFLNEVYDRLGLPRTKAGAIVGWIQGKNTHNFIDFGIYDPRKNKARDFVNGYEPAIMLDFNVDGVIYDLI